MAMIEAVSVATGDERRVEVAAAPDGVRVAIREKRRGTVMAGVTVPADGLMTVLSEQPAGSQVIAGEGGELDVEIRRNEVWLSTGGADAAVGLDDLMDALAAVAG